MLRSLAFLTSIPETAIEQANINEDARMHSVSEMLKYSIEHSVWHKIVINSFAGSMNEWTNKGPTLPVCHVLYRLTILIK